jgi:hypothetical protein
MGGGGGKVKASPGSLRLATLATRGRGLEGDRVPGSAKIPVGAPLVGARGGRAPKNRRVDRDAGTDLVRAFRSPLPMRRIRSEARAPTRGASTGFVDARAMVLSAINRLPRVGEGVSPC